MILPKISIITPSFNQGRYLEQTIRSVISQDYTNLEYIVIDGESTDNSINIIQKFEDKLAYWCSEPDKGQSDAINKGFERATGEWLMWLNSDDYLIDNCIRTVLNLVKPVHRLIIGDGLLVNDTEELLYTKRANYLDFKELIQWGTVPNQPSVIFHRNLLEEAGGRLRSDLHYVLDWYLWLGFSRFLKKQDQLIVKKPIAISRVWDGNKTSNGTFEKGYYEVLKIYHELAKEGLIEYSKIDLKTIFKRRAKFISSKKDLFNYSTQGFLKFGDLKFLHHFIKNFHRYKY